MVRPAVAAVPAGLWARGARQAIALIMVAQPRFATVDQLPEVLGRTARLVRPHVLRELVAVLPADSRALGELDVVGAPNTRGLPGAKAWTDCCARTPGC